MISEGSCDTKDCNNDSENSALHNMYKLHLKCIKIENSHFKLQWYFTILLFLLYFWSNKRLNIKGNCTKYNTFEL